MTPQFKDLKFKSNSEFNTWLVETSKFAIILEDRGQDMQTIYVHKSGEILHCDFHAKIYNGRFVNMKSLEVRSPIEISTGNLFETQGRLVVEELKSLIN
jgi:hypothetical protein